MLSVYLGKMEEAVYYPPVYFDNRYEDEWITDKQSVEIIRDVDKSDVVSAHLIESPVLGPISPKELSGGVKTVLLMLFDETGRIFNDLNGWCMLPYKFIDIMKKIVKMINKMPAMSILFLLYCIK